MEETSFYNASVQGVPVKVTNARFIVGAQTYAMNGVTSVKAGEQPKKLGGPIVVILLGLIFLISGSYTLGVIIAAAGAVFLYFAKATYTVVLSSSSGEVTALSGHDAGEVKGVVGALNEAIIHRG
jgi:Family of unknown function (DUF6232)